MQQEISQVFAFYNVQERTPIVVHADPREQTVTYLPIFGPMEAAIRYRDARIDDLVRNRPHLTRQEALREFTLVNAQGVFAIELSDVMHAPIEVPDIEDDDFYLLNVEDA